MKLIDVEVEHDDEEVPEVPRPPRPEHRRVYVSLFFTISVLVGTVAAVYTLFPKRDHEILTAAAEAHRGAGPYELEAPTAGEVSAWSLGVFGEPAPFPDDVDAVGALRFTVLRRPGALVRYRAGDDEFSVAVLQARDAPPRAYHRIEGDVYLSSWRKGAWTLIAVGPAATADRWKSAIGAP